MQLSVGAQIDRYTLEAPIGEGGMAVVYRVRHNQLGTAHALKILVVSSNSIRQRLLREGRVQASLRHPNIVSVTDVIEVDGQPGLVMEYVGGPTLTELLEKHELTVEQADLLAEGILSGVACAHRQNLIHRDLKPSNILISLGERGLIPKVADFGLVKALSSDEHVKHKTRSGVTMGTPAYMSPEQIRDTKNVDARADIFSLGVIFYEMMCRQLPFAGDDLFDLYSSVTSGEYIPPRELVPEIPQRIEDAIIGALRVDVDKRIEDCDTLLAIWKGEISKRKSLPPSAPRHPWGTTLMSELSDSDEDTNSGVRGSGAETVSWGDGTLADFENGAQEARQTTLADTFAEAAEHPTDTAQKPASVEPKVLVLPTIAGDPSPAANEEEDTVILKSPRRLSGAVFASVSVGLLLLGSIGTVALIALILGNVTGLPSFESPGDDPHALSIVEPPEPDESMDAEGDEDGEPSDVTAVDEHNEPDPPSATLDPPTEPATPKPPVVSATPKPAPAPIPVVAKPDPKPVVPKPEPVVPKPAPTPSSRTGTVHISGDATSVVLIAADGTRLPATGSIPAGTYDIEAEFPGLGSVGAGSVTVIPGATINLSCRSGFYTCNVR